MPHSIFAFVIKIFSRPQYQSNIEYNMLSFHYNNSKIIAVAN